jgi:hypothetical protein
LSTWEDIASWFHDESGVSNLDVVCNSGGSEISQSIDGSLWINVDGVSEVSCEAIDATGKSSGNRTWNVGVPVTISTSALILQEQHPLRISHSEAWTEDTTVRLALIQDGQYSGIQEFHKGNSSYQDVLIQPQGVVPGPVSIWIEVIVGELSSQQTLNLGIVKESAPPSLTIGSGIFDGKMWRVGGQFSDPDGETVTFTIVTNGVDLGQIVISGNTWESEWIDLSVFTSELIDVRVTGCDQSGKCTTTSITVDTSLMVEEIPDLPDEGEDSVGSIPALGIPSLTIAISVAVLFKRRSAGI